MSSPLRSALPKAEVFMLAGGEGRRLRPLTNSRPKPLVPFGGAYRIIDFALSNALHSQCERVYVVAQFGAEQVIRYLSENWTTVGTRRDFAVPLRAQPGRQYRGTYDALTENLHLAERNGARDAIVISADHIYRMDYLALLAFHRAQEADATIATTAVVPGSLSQYGVVRIDGDTQVTDFLEKPADAEMWSQYGLPPYLVNMGVYVFRIDVLRSSFDRRGTDIGRHLLPRLVQQERVVAYRFDETRSPGGSFWADVGTLDSYFEAHRALLRGEVAPEDTDWPVRGGMRPQVSRRAGNGAWANSIVASSATVQTPDVYASVIGPGSFVGPDASVHDAILMPGASIGANTHVRRAIVGDDVRVPEGKVVGLAPTPDSRAVDFASRRSITVVGNVSAAAWSRTPPSWGRGLILLAEGNNALRESARETLEAEGYAVLAASSAVRFMELMVRYRAIVRVVVCGTPLDGNTQRNLVQLVRDNLPGHVPVALRVDEDYLLKRGPEIPRPDALLTLSVPGDAAQLVATVNELALGSRNSSSRDKGLYQTEADAGVPADLQIARSAKR